MKTIVILDDKDHALKQIEYEFPQGEWPNYNTFHFDTFELFQRQKINRIDILFLDFFLSKDRLYGKDILENIQTYILVCFSSKKEMSDAIAQAAIKGGYFLYKDVYSVRKLKGTLENSDLRKVLEEVTGRLKEVA